MNNLDDIITPTFNWLKEKNKVAIATVISTWGSAPRQLVVKWLSTRLVKL